MPVDFDLPMIVFWASVGGVVYHYVGYPVVIWALARMFGRSRHCPEHAPSTLPFVSILVSALNEEDVISARIQNALDTDYPADRFEFVVASDGSTDRTAAIVRSFTDPRVTLFDFPNRRGKALVLNEVIPKLRGEVVVLSDANTTIEPPVVARFVRWLTEPDVGAVVGRLLLTDPVSGKNVDGVYWRYETFLKQCEARLGALLGANGAIYGFRRDLFVPLPTDTLVDDFVLPLLMKLRSGSTLIYDTDSVAHEEAPTQLASEFGRRSRIGAGGFSSLRVLWPLVLPVHGWTSFAFVSHKLLRWICPLLMLGALVSNLFLLNQPFYVATLSAQVLFYAAAAAGAALPGSSAPVRILRLATLFTSVNMALVIGLWRWIVGQRGATWQRTARSSQSSDASAAPGDARSHAADSSKADSTISV
jgi:cellulose synthase/poly-beta-1,6-N-acetylglucosamine synthase-like glycosyltransferase